MYIYLHLWLIKNKFLAFSTFDKLRQVYYNYEKD